MEWRERINGDDRVGAELRHMLSDKFARRLRGAVWSNCGSDPGEVSCEAFCDILWKRIPPDVNDKIIAESIIWLRRRLLPCLRWNGGLLCSGMRDAGQLLEIYFGILRFVDADKRNIHLLQYGDMRGVIAVAWRRASRARNRARPNWRGKSLYSVARSATEFIKGNPVQPPAPRGGEDLVDGYLNTTEWQIVVPLSADAARYWGSGTFWCTSVVDSRGNFFEKYYRPELGFVLFVFMNRRTGNVYQFEYGSKQFKDFTNNTCEDPRLIQLLHNMLLENLQHDRYFASRVSSVQSWIWNRARSLAVDELGLLHSDLGGIVLPAVVGASGNKFWFKHGYLHSWNDAPSYIQQDGSQFWHRDGVLHRESGPAIIWADGKQEWWRDGVLVSAR